MRHRKPLPPDIADLERRLLALLAEPEIAAISGWPWMGSGCGILAVGLCEWLGSTSSQWVMYDTVSSDHRAWLHQVLARVNGWCIAASGISGEKDLEVYWRKRHIEPDLLPARAAELRYFKVPLDPAKSAQLAQILEARLGSGQAMAQMLSAQKPPAKRKPRLYAGPWADDDISF